MLRIDAVIRHEKKQYKLEIFILLLFLSKIFDNILVNM